jgi:hypothetical protein
MIDVFFFFNIKFLELLNINNFFYYNNNKYYKLMIFKGLNNIIYIFIAKIK